MPTKNPNEIDSNVNYNQEILKFVKIRFFQQKNHNFFVKQFIKPTFIAFNQRQFRQDFMEK